MKQALNILCVVAFAMLSLTNCATDKSTDQELQRAQAAIEAAEFTYSLAVVVYGPRLTSPGASAAEKLVAEKIIEEARKRLASEKARLADIQARRSAAALPPNLLLPPLTEAK